MPKEVRAVLASGTTEDKQVETNDEEVIYPGAEPTMDIEVRTDAKYLIAITKYPDKEKES